MINYRFLLLFFSFCALQAMDNNIELTQSVNTVVIVPTASLNSQNNLASQESENKKCCTLRDTRRYCHRNKNTLLLSAIVGYGLLNIASDVGSLITGDVMPAVYVFACSNVVLAGMIITADPWDDTANEDDEYFV